MYFGPAKNEAVEKLREEECFVGCGQCRFFNVKADLPGAVSTCKRLDHKTVKFALPWFKSYDCGQNAAHMCSEFEPSSTWKWLYAHWCGTDDYVGEIPSEERIWFTLGDDRSVRYAASMKEFYNGTFVQSGFLRCYGKMYYIRKRSSPIGYDLVREEYEEPMLIALDQRGEVAT